MVQFVYQPRSGDRVVAARPSAEIVVVRWANGCRHVVGGIALTYRTALLGHHWRARACTTATIIVHAVGGGVVWDAQGDVTLVVPPRFAFAADQRMRGARGEPTGWKGATPDDLARLRDWAREDDVRNEATMLAAGAATLAVDGDALVCYPATPPAQPQFASYEVLFEGRPVVRLYVDDGVDHPPGARPHTDVRGVDGWAVDDVQPLYPVAPPRALAVACGAEGVQ